LLQKRHKKHFTAITEAKDVNASPAIIRLIAKQLKGYDAFSDENYDMILKMVLIGLNNDFYCKGKALGEAEKRFDITNEDPPYRIMGFIDKHAIDKKNSTVNIIDYKSSKKKFRGEELKSNTQAMMYSLAAKELWPKVKRRIVDFLFLRFPRQPIQELEFTDDQLRGFEYYLSHISEQVNNFTEELAKTNYAADKETRWLCGPAKSGWICPLHKPFDYYVMLDKKSRVVQTKHKESELALKDGYTIEKRHYTGCPRFNNASGEACGTMEDPFDF
tara:strand:- start:408 stop:1229 length:822 start_codon:yes stop_codon:yes gene_type:complete